MDNINIARNLRVLIITSIIAMTIPGYSQDVPSYDKINTSDGVVEMHFIGHGSLMFKVNGFVIHIDPVSSMGDYENLPKADIILVTHEHGDHLDVPLIEKLKKEVDKCIMVCSNCHKEIHAGIREV